MKRIVSLILTVAILLSFAPAVYAAKPELFIKVKDKDQLIYQDSEFYLSVYIDNVPDELFSYMLVLNYDPEKVEFVSIEADRPEKGITGPVTNDKENGVITFAYSRVTANLNTLLADVKFKVLEEGEATFSIDEEKTILAAKSTEEDIEIAYAADDFTLNIGEVPENPTIKSGSNSFTIYKSTKFSITSADEECKYYYTTNGDTPTTEDFLYDSKDDVYISKSCTLKAIAVKYGVASEVTSKKITYTVDPVTLGGGGNGTGSYAPSYPTYPTVTPSPAATAAPTAEPYSDIEGHWAENHIKRLINKGIINGYEDGTVRPDNLVTRAEAAKIMASAIGQTAAAEVNLTFADTADIADWAKPWVQAAINAGFVTGYDDNTFKPNQSISRKELAVMAMRAFGYGTSDEVLAFTDAAQIPDWAYGHISKAVSLSIITGYEDNTFQPDKNVTRAEVCTIVAKCLNK